MEEKGLTTEVEIYGVSAKYALNLMRKNVLNCLIKPTACVKGYNQYYRWMLAAKALKH